MPPICQYLSEETKQRVFLTTDKDEQNSKINGFFNSVEPMWNEMKWRRKLKQQNWLYWFSSQITLWSDISFGLAVLINLLIAFFYPFSNEDKSRLIKLEISIFFNHFYLRIICLEIETKWNLTVWLALLISSAFVYGCPNKNTARVFSALVIIRLIFSVGLPYTIFIIGIINVSKFICESCHFKIM